MKTMKSLLMVAATLLLTGCGGKKTAELTVADVTVTPLPLTYMNKMVQATVAIQLPPQSVPKMALTSFAFEMRYGIQHQFTEKADETLTVQGEMLESHYPIISFKNGKRITIAPQFAYKEGMENGQLVLKMTTQNGKKSTQRELVLTESVLSTPAFAVPILHNEREAEGIGYLQQGRYTLAAAILEQLGSNNNTLVAQILAQDFMAAKTTLEKIASPDATTHYLRAVLGARMENESEVRAGLKAVGESQSQLLQRAKTDIEFQHYQKVVGEFAN